MLSQLTVVNRVWLFCVFCFGGQGHVVVGVLAVLASLEVVVYVPSVLAGVELPSVLLLAVHRGLRRRRCVACRRVGVSRPDLFDTTDLR